MLLFSPTEPPSGCLSTQPSMEKWRNIRMGETVEQCKNAKSKTWCFVEQNCWFHHNEEAESKTITDKLLNMEEHFQLE